VPLNEGWPHETEVDARLAVTEVRQVDATWHLPACQPSTRRVSLLLLLHHGWACAIGVLLPLHTAGVLEAPAAAPVATLPHSGGDLHPLM
jgi:hypothetical protein